MRTALLITLLLSCVSVAAVSTSETTREYFTLGAGTTTFTSTIKCNSSDDVNVYKRLVSTGLETALTLTTDYTISPTNSSYLNGFTVTVTPALGVLYQVVIERDIKKSQETSSGSINKDTICAAIDKLTRLVQDTRVVTDRCYKMPASDPASKTSTLPSSISRASKYLSFDTDGNPTATSVVTSGSLSISAFGESFAAAADATAGLAILGGPTAIKSYLSLPYLSVTDYGATGDGVTDDSSYIQAAIDAAESSGGGEVYFPEATYNVATGLTIEADDVSLVFEQGAVIDWSGSATGTVLTIGTGTTQFRNNLTDVRILHTTTMTGGIAIYYDTCNTYCINRVQIEDAFCAVKMEDGGDGEMNNVHFVDTKANGTVLLLDNVGDFSIDTGTFQGAVGAQPLYAIHITEGSGPVYISNLDIFQQGIGVYFNPATGVAINSVWIDRCHIEGGTTGVKFSGAGFVNMTHITNCSTAINTLNGVYSNVDNLHFCLIEGLRCYSNGLAGVSFTKGAGTFEDFVVSNSSIWGNSTDASAAESGIYVGANTSNFRILNTRSGTVTGFGGTHYDYQDYGIEIASGTGDYYSITNCDLTGNVTGGLTNGATGTHYFTYGNLTGQTTFSVNQAVISSVGVQTTATSVTATADGLTTALIPANTGHVTITASNANYAVVLPAAVPGTRIVLSTPTANGCELWATGSNVKINDVVSSATNEAALAADSHFEAFCVSSTEWILIGYTKLGAVIAAIVPDAR